MANHWSHILVWQTDFYIDYLTTEQKPAEYDWFDAHYDIVMSGTINEHKSRNTSIKAYPYVLLWTVIQSGTANVYDVYYTHMQAWYVLNEEYDIEDAFLHDYDGAARHEVTIWDSVRWCLNPKDPGNIAYQSARINEIMTTAIGGYYPDGVFVDEHATGDIEKIFDASQDYVEYHSSGNTAAQFIAYKADETSLLTAIKTVIGSSKRMLPNTGPYISQPNIDWIIAAGGTHLERLNSAYNSFPENNYYGFIDTLLAQDILISFSGQPTGENPDGYTAGNSDSANHRHELWKLSSYYTVVDVNAAKVAFSTGNAMYPTAYPISSWWNAAIETNIGHPTQARQSYQTGTVGGKTYLVYSRDFDNALILNRPKYDYTCTVYDDTTLVAIALPGTDTWYPLSSAGVLGLAITTINLRNAEGAILMKGSEIKADVTLGADGTLTFGAGGSIII